MTQKLGFIGLGIMGRGMARNLLKAGFDLTVWNRTPARMDELAADGAHMAASPRELAQVCDVIFVCVSDTPDVEAVLLGENGAIHGLSAGKLIVDHSTISPQATKDIAQKDNRRWRVYAGCPRERRERGRGQRHAQHHGGRRCRTA